MTDILINHHTRADINKQELRIVANKKIFYGGGFADAWITLQTY